MVFLELDIEMIVIPPFLAENEKAMQMLVFQVQNTVLCFDYAIIEICEKL